MFNTRAPMSSALKASALLGAEDPKTKDIFVFQLSQRATVTACTYTGTQRTTVTARTYCEYTGTQRTTVTACTYYCCIVIASFVSSLKGETYFSIILTLIILTLILTLIIQLFSEYDSRLFSV